MLDVSRPLGARASVGVVIGASVELTRHRVEAWIVSTSVLRTPAAAFMMLMKRLWRLPLYQCRLNGAILVIVIVAATVVVVVDLVVPLQGDLLGLARRAYLRREIHLSSFLDVMRLPLSLSLRLR